MQDTIKELEDIARLIRIDVVTMIHKAGDGHPGASLSVTDMITALYFHAMNIDLESHRDSGFFIGSLVE